MIFLSNYSVSLTVFFISILLTLFLLGCTFNPKDCESLPSLGKYSCYHELALEKKDLNTCSKAGTYADLCVLDLDKIVSQDAQEMYNICSAYALAKTGVSCQLSIAEQKQDANICAHLIDGNVSLGQLMSVCVVNADKNKTNDLNLLSNLCNDTYGTIFSNDCFEAVAINRASPELCNNLKSIIPSSLEQDIINCKSKVFNS